MTKKTKRQALTSSLTSRANTGDVLVIKAIEMANPKTKEIAGILKAIDLYRRKVLVVLEKSDEAVIKSARNIPGVRVTLANMVSTYDVIWADKILLTSDAITKMEEVFAS